MTVGHSNDLNREARIHPSLWKGEKVAERPQVPQASPRRTHPRGKSFFKSVFLGFSGQFSGVYQAIPMVCQKKMFD